MFPIACLPAAMFFGVTKYKVQDCQCFYKEPIKGLCVHGCQSLKMSASSTPVLVSKSTDKMKLVLTKDNRVRSILSKSPSETSVTKATTTPSVSKKSVIREPPPKVHSEATCTKPIVVPSVPNLLSIIKGQSTLSQFFSSSTVTSVPPPNLSAPPPSKPTSSSYAHSTTVSQHIKPIASFYNKIVQQASLKPEVPLLKPKKDPSPVKPPAKMLPKIPKKVSNSVTGTPKKPPRVRQTENGVTVKDRDIQPPKPKKAKVATGSSSASLPLSRVRTIMKTHVQSSQNMANTGQESIALVARATVSVLPYIHFLLFLF